MPYEVAFKKRIAVADGGLYINDCCYGGDVISARLLPSIKEHYGEVRANQEDWGWFIWFKGRTVSLAVDIFCDDRESGQFRVHLTARKKRWLVLDAVTDVPELKDLKALVVGLLDGWAEGACQVVKLDQDYRPSENTA